MPNLNATMVCRIRLPCPPIEEQSAILRFVSDGAAQVAAISHRAHEEVLLLREYRTRLFSDVLTGQIDVRAAAAALPDDLPEAEPLDDVDAGEEDSLDADELAPEEDDPR